MCITALEQELDQAHFIATFKNGLVLLLQGHWYPVATVIFNHILRHFNTVHEKD